MRAVQWPHAGRCNCPSIVGCGTGCSGQASRRRARPSHSRVSRQPGSAASLLGQRWQGWWVSREKENKEERCLQTPGPAAIPGRGFPRGARAVVPALAADNAVSLLAAPYQRGGDGQAGSHPERSVLGAVGKGSWPPSPRSQPRAVYFYTGCFLSGLKPSCTAAGAGPGPPRLISLP